MIGPQADVARYARVLPALSPSPELRTSGSRLSTPDLPSRAHLHIREAAGMKSAWAQAFLKRSSASAAWSSFCWARRLWINPISAHPLSGCRRRSASIDRFRFGRATGQQEHRPKMVPHGQRPERRLRVWERLFHLDRFLEQPDRVIIVLPARGEFSCQDPLSNFEKRPLSLFFRRPIPPDLLREAGQDESVHPQPRGAGQSQQGRAPAPAATSLPSIAIPWAAAVPSATPPTGRTESSRRSASGGRVPSSGLCGLPPSVMVAVKSRAAFMASTLRPSIAKEAQRKWRLCV